MIVTVQDSVRARLLPLQPLDDHGELKASTLMFPEAPLRDEFVKVKDSV